VRIEREVEYEIGFMIRDKSMTLWRRRRVLNRQKFVDIYGM